MKLLSFILFVCSAITASALSLVWDASLDNNTTAYNIYQDTIVTPIANVPAPTTTFLLPLATLSAGAHTFFVTAADQRGESTPTNTVTLPALPGPPTNLRITP